MSRFHKLRAISWLTPLLLLASCAGAPIQLGNIWTNPEYKAGGFSKILVIGIATNVKTEQMFEQQLAVQLIGQGVQAVPRQDVLPSDEIVDKDSILAAIAGSNIDAVLVTRLLRLDTETQFVEGSAYASPGGYYMDYWGYYRTAYSVVHTPGYFVETTTATLESNLYQVSDEKLIWTAQSRTIDPSDVVGNIESLSMQVTKDLAERGLLKK